MKKFLSFLLVLVLSFALVACDRNDDVKTSTEQKTSKPVESSEPTEEEDNIVVTFAVQSDSTDALDKIVEEFNKKYKDEGIQVKVVKMTNDSSQMKDQLVQSLNSGSSEYDVISMDVVWAAEFAAAGFLESVQSILLAEKWKTSDFNAGSMQAAFYNGILYALPYFPDLGVLYFRSDIVSEQDAEKLKSGDYTWDDLFDMAEKYKGQKGTEYGILFQAINNEALICNLNEFSDNFENLKEGLQMMRKFVDSDITPDDITQYNEGKTEAFTNGKAVFARNWPYMNGLFKEDTEGVISPEQVDFAPLPEGGTVGGWLVGINKNSENIAAAKQFITFLAGPEGQKINATVGSYLPGYNPLLENKDVLDANSLLRSEAFQKALTNTISRPVLGNYSEAADQIITAAHEYLTKENPTEADLNKAVSAIESALGR